ncbi:hydrolase activity protein [[Candida] boidinii]|uniref:Unnamed protein product n=1 Tax=Candida boidinii TaxID=5477 RepID=A0ACB5TDZ6_CANBO|nr:hydrolase activity protein [[Candida] boidinii]GME86990.1 unnamed protein product [[Candida] boidinii]
MYCRNCCARSSFLTSQRLYQQQYARQTIITKRFLNTQLKSFFSRQFTSKKKSQDDTSTTKKSISSSSILSSFLSASKSFSAKDEDLNSIPFIKNNPAATISKTSTKIDNKNNSPRNGSPKLTTSKVLSTDKLSKFKFNYATASYIHHGTGRQHTQLSSLSDLSDVSNLGRILPRRRAPGSPSDTISIRTGDDAMICSPKLLGVADGVSNWTVEGADPGYWARVLLESTSMCVTRYEDQVEKNITPEGIKAVMDDAFQKTLEIVSSEGVQGSSTLLLSTIVDKFLHIVSIGDSKIFVVRDGEILLTNEEQMKSYLCPIQLGTNHGEVLPSQVVWYKKVELEKDDIIIVCSDGLTDNVWEDELLVYVDRLIFLEKKSLKDLANKLLYKAKDIAFDNFAVCPYVDKVNALPSNKGGEFIMGGKMDDISICVAQVSDL